MITIEYIGKVDHIAIIKYEKPKLNVKLKKEKINFFGHIFNFKQI